MNLPGVLRQSDIFKQEQNECAETALLAAAVWKGTRKVQNRSEFLKEIGEIKKMRQAGSAGTVLLSEAIHIARNLDLSPQETSLQSAILRTNPFILRLCWGINPMLNDPSRIGLDLAKIFARGYEWHVVLAFAQNQTDILIFDPNFSFPQQPTILKSSELTLRSAQSKLDWENRAIVLS